MEEGVLRLKELLFPSIADVEVLSVDVNIEIVRVDAHCTADGAVCPVCGVCESCGRIDEVEAHHVAKLADTPTRRC
ncbi:hypothetical protein OG318_01780 [Streptomyces sp. NBC_01483]|nr:hypothetical protein [Streptomyces sp. NBC_01483]